MKIFSFVGDSKRSENSTRIAPEVDLKFFFTFDPKIKVFNHMRDVL